MINSIFVYFKNSNFSFKLIFFVKNFFNNINFNEKEINFLLDKMFVKVTILHPIEKRELSCYGKVNDYELK